MLNEMRFGRLTQKSITKFKNLSRNVVYNDGLGPTELYVLFRTLAVAFKVNLIRFPRREDVERANIQRLQALQGEAHTFTAVDGGALTDQQSREKILGNMMAQASLTLKVNCQVSYDEHAFILSMRSLQVMLIKNTDETLVNGSMVSSAMPRPLI